MASRFLSIADYFVPVSAQGDVEQVKRARAVVYLSWTGAFWTALFAGIYSSLGSPISGMIILTLSFSLLIAPFVMSRGASIPFIAHCLTSVTWLMSFVVAWRTGGFYSPAIVWGFFHPVTMYSVCGIRAAFVWAFLSALQIFLIYLWQATGGTFMQDFPPDTALTVFVASLMGCIAAFAMVLVPMEIARRSSLDALGEVNRTLERSRILSDMHDGIGAQLTVTAMQVRDGKLDRKQLLQQLETCLDDLRLIVDAMDPNQDTLEVALVNLLTRLQPRMSDANIELYWEITLDRRGNPGGNAALQILRIVQEAFTNALRHADARNISLYATGNSLGLTISISDNGRGIDSDNRPGTGHGMDNMRKRAERLNGTLNIDSDHHGTRITLHVPVDRAGRLAAPAIARPR